MTDSSLTHLYVLLDRSGSMQSIKSDTIGGFAAFIDQQRHSAGRCRVTLAQFDDQYEIVYSGRNLDEIPELDLQPRGMTALLDAMGRYITDTGQELADLSEPERPGTVIMVVITDGYENASREFTKDVVREMVERQAATYSWVFSYLGANQDAITVGQGLGVQSDRAMTYAGHRVGSAFAAAGANLAAYRAAVVGGMSPEAAAPAAAFTQAQRDEAVAPAEG